MRRTLAAVVLGFSTVMAIPPPAHAQSSAAAEALYRDGQRLLQAGNVHDACIKFAESERLEQASGTLLNLANCHEREGKTASAWGEYAEAIALASRSGQKDREQYAREHAAALEKQLRTLLVAMVDAPAGTQIALDGQPFGSGAIGTALPTDPGEHEISVSAPKKKTWSTKVTLQPGPGTTKVDVPRLEDASSETPPAATLANTHQAAGSDIQSDSGKSPQPKRTIGYVVGGAGILALGAGLFFVLRAKSLKNQSDDEQQHAFVYAGNGDAANAKIQHDAAVNDFDSAKSNQTIGLIAGGAGIVAIGVGAYLVLTSKAPARTAASMQIVPLISPNVAGAGASFTF